MAKKRHTGWPSQEEYKEIVGLIANAVTITVPSLAAVYAGWGLDSIKAFWLIPGVFGLISAAFAWFFVFEAVKGDGPFRVGTIMVLSLSVLSCVVPLIDFALSL